MKDKSRFSGRVINVIRLLNSRSGNPRYRLVFDNGMSWATAKDSNVNYTISESLHTWYDKHVEVEMTGLFITGLKELA
jgi:hypothetical protein